MDVEDLLLELEQEIVAERALDLIAALKAEVKRLTRERKLDAAKAGADRAFLLAEIERLERERDRAQGGER